MHEKQLAREAGRLLNAQGKRSCRERMRDTRGDIAKGCAGKGGRLEMVGDGMEEIEGRGRGRRVGDSSLIPLIYRYPSPPFLSE